MNKELNIGDYVRTKSGEITRITKVCIGAYVNEVYVEDDVYTEYWGRKTDCLHIGTDWKSSPNIIDLIEAGDYVNGYPVAEIYQSTNEELGKIIKFADDNVMGYEYEVEELCEAFGDKIKSIVTKEMYSSVEYRVETN